MTCDKEDCSSIGHNGWRQGSVLPPAVVRALTEQAMLSTDFRLRADVAGREGRQLNTSGAQLTGDSQNKTDISTDSDRWMVISQDCDLVQRDWRKEPYVELIRVCNASDNKSAQEWERSPRELLFREPPGALNGERFVCSIHDRVRIDRRYLTDCKPDTKRALNTENVARIIRWISRRYVRASFPDNFNHRVKKELEKLASRKSNAFYRNGDLITGVYMRLTEEELPKDKDYEIDVWAAVRPIDYDNSDTRDVVQEALELLETTLAGCSGIAIKSCELKSEQDITLNHLHSWKRWDFDLLSLRPKRKGDPLPDLISVPQDGV